MPELRHAAAPGGETRGGAENDHGGSVLPTLADSDHAATIAAHVNGAFVTLVETTHGKYRRRCYLTLQAAQDAAQRATDAGQNVVVVLAELKPLYRITAGGDGR